MSIDHFCIDGNVFECDAREWTNYLTRQSKCICRPGLFRSEEFTACTENFCDGTDDLQKECPLNSISDANSTSLQQCLCVPGYGHVHAQNYTLAHTCVSCESGKFKDTYGMHLCTPCRKCLAVNNIYELHSCTTVHDSVCDSCETRATRTTPTTIPVSCRSPVPTTKMQSADHAPCVILQMNMKKYPVHQRPVTPSVLTSSKLQNSV